MSQIIHYMAKHLNNDKKVRDFVAARLKQAEELAEYWREISRKIQRNEKVEISIDERPDETILKA